MTDKLDKLRLNLQGYTYGSIIFVKPNCCSPRFQNWLDIQIQRILIKYGLINTHQCTVHYLFILYLYLHIRRKQKTEVTNLLIWQLEDKMFEVQSSSRRVRYPHLHNKSISTLLPEKITRKNT